MSVFSIICKSCAAKLKVAKPSLIGQILACPKCGTMIEVQPPPGWEPPVDPTAPVVSVFADADITTTTEVDRLAASFDDIDTVLKSTETQSPVGKRREPNRQPGRAGSTPGQATSGSTSALTKPKSGPSKSLDSSQPILPNEQWTSPAVQHRKKLLLWIAAITGIGMLLIATIVAILNSDKSSDSPVSLQTKPEAGQPAEKEVSDEAPIGIEPADSDRPDDKSKVSGIAPSVPESDKPTDQTLQVAPPMELPLPADELNPTGDSPSPLEDSSIKPLEILAEPPVIPDLVANPDDDSKTKAAVSPAQLPLNNLESFQSKMGDLFNLLEASGTSVARIQDLADSEQEEQLIGVPKYLIEPPGSEKLDLEKQLSLPCSGLRYADAKLSTVLQDITSIIGIAVTVDPYSLRVVGDSADPSINVDLKDMDYGSTLDAVIKPLGLVKSVNEQGGLVVHVVEREVFKEFKHPLPNFPVADNAGREQAATEMLNAIRALIEPKSWLLDQNPATVSYSENEINVYNTVLANEQVSEFIAKLNASLLLKDDSTNASAQEILTTKWTSIAEKLQQPAGLNHVPEQTLGKFLDQIRQKTGITVLVDWETLQPLGWTPLTRVPGQIDEETVGEVLKQLGRAMKLSVLAIDKSTVQLTTFEKAANSIDLEFYHFGKILAGKLNEEQALALMMQTLGHQLQAPQVRFIYEPKYQTLVVSAPQSLQRQLAAVLQRLENL